MKNSPYMVPEGYFEHAEDRILENARRIDRRRKAILTICPIILILAVSAFFFSDADSPRLTAAVMDNCDIFMEIFEY